MAKSDYMIEDKKDVFRIEKGIQVDGNASMLVVECNLNRTKATYTIKSQLTTKQVHPTSEQINRGTLSAMADIFIAVIEEAEKRRLEILRQNKDLDPDPDQLEIFNQHADDDLPFEAGEAGEPEGAFESGEDTLELVLTDDMNASEKKVAKTNFINEWMSRNPDIKGAREIARQIDHPEINNQFVGRVIKATSRQ